MLRYGGLFGLFLVSSHVRDAMGMLWAFSLCVFAASFAAGSGMTVDWPRPRFGSVARQRDAARKEDPE
jgi:hypothetical protein